MGKRFLAAAVGAVVLFVWGFLMWGVLAMSLGIFEPLPNEAAILDVVDREVPASGMYFSPAEMTEDGQYTEATLARHRTGPIVHVFVHKEGADLMSPMLFVKGLAHNFASALIACWLVGVMAVSSYRRRVAAFFLLGLFTAVATEFGDPIWWYHPWDSHLFGAVYLAGGWLLAGLVMAKLLPSGSGET